MGLDINVFGQTYNNIKGITVSAVNNESTYTFIVPTETLTVSADGIYDITSYAKINVIHNNEEYENGDNLSYGEISSSLVDTAKVGTAYVGIEE